MILYLIGRSAEAIQIAAKVAGWLIAADSAGLFKKAALSPSTYCRKKLSPLSKFKRKYSLDSDYRPLKTCICVYCTRWWKRNRK